MALILDYHFTNANGQEEFVNQVEFLVLKHMNQNIFHNVEIQLMEISKWVREKRKEYTTVIKGENGSKNIGFSDEQILNSITNF